MVNMNKNHYYIIDFMLINAVFFHVKIKGGLYVMHSYDKNKTGTFPLF